MPFSFPTASDDCLRTCDNSATTQAQSGFKLLETMPAKNLAFETSASKLPVALHRPIRLAALSGRTARRRTFSLLQRKVFQIAHPAKPAIWYKDERAIRMKGITDLRSRLELQMRGLPMNPGEGIYTFATLRDSRATMVSAIPPGSIRRRAADDPGSHQYL